jgi:hypothetical protein
MFLKQVGLGNNITFGKIEFYGTYNSPTDIILNSTSITSNISLNDSTSSIIYWKNDLK